MAGHTDTNTYDSGFHGVWGVFPFSGHDETIVYASDIENGLWVLELDDSWKDHDA